MDMERWKEILEEFHSGKRSLDDMLEKIKNLPYEDVGFVKIDHHRHLRCGFPEVIYGKGKSAAQLKEILGRMKRNDSPVLVTKTNEKIYEEVKEDIPEARYHPKAGALTIRYRKKRGIGMILVLTAGTLDIPVAEEAALTAELMGSRVKRIYDVGVAGIHRLIDQRGELEKARVIIAVAGMEGALPSVVGGLVSVPVIGLPTSIGYGTNLGGFTPLLTMLNSCSTGIAVVNIDNGFGAGHIASLINARAVR